METSERMETGDKINTSVTATGVEAPAPFQMAPRSSESPNQFVGSSVPPMETPVASAGSGEASVKKRRGRPRKYEANGTALPVHIPSSTLHVKKKRGRHSGFDMMMHNRMGLHSSGEGYGAGSSVGVGSSAGAIAGVGAGSNFTPHILTVNSGEDITMRVISFSQQGPRAVCILSANGVISNVTLRQPDSSGGTLTYEGRFEILSLSGSFMEAENQGTKGRSGGMSISLAGPDGRVVGGGVAGLLIAATPIQVVVGSFAVGGDQQQDHLKPRKQKMEYSPATGMSMTSPLPPPAAFFAAANADREQPQSSYGVSSWSNGQDNQRKSATDINVPLTSD